MKRFIYRLLKMGRDAHERSTRFLDGFPYEKQKTEKPHVYQREREM
jgi:hypothetical protein